MVERILREFATSARTGAESRGRRPRVPETYVEAHWKERGRHGPDWDGYYEHHPFPGYRAWVERMERFDGSLVEQRRSPPPVRRSDWHRDRTPVSDDTEYVDDPLCFNLWGPIAGNPSTGQFLGLELEGVVKCDGNEFE